MSLSHVLIKTEAHQAVARIFVGVERGNTSVRLYRQIRKSNLRRTIHQPVFIKIKNRGLHWLRIADLRTAIVRRKCHQIAFWNDRSDAEQALPPLPEAVPAFDMAEIISSRSHIGVPSRQVAVD